MRGLLGQAAAAALDVELMTSPGFSIDQLMELAGLSVACALAAVFTPGARVIAVCGPGNNGGDGLVAARHLYHFGYRPTILYPKPSKRELFTNLVAQAAQLGIPFVEEFPQNAADDFDVLLDGVFGFSFDSKSEIRAPFGTILQHMVEVQDVLPIASIDIPSGWDVERGDISGSGLRPDVLISLTAPKLSATHFAGSHHFLGGRFLPPDLAEKYGLSDLPAFQGSDQIVRIDQKALRVLGHPETPELRCGQAGAL